MKGGGGKEFLKRWPWCIPLRSRYLFETWRRRHFDLPNEFLVTEKDLPIHFFPGRLFSKSA